MQAGGMPGAAVGMVVPAALRMPPLAPPGPPEMSVLLAPGGDALQRGPALRAGAPAFAVLVPLALLAPPQRPPQACAAGVPGTAGPTARAEPCRRTRECQAALPSPWPQPGVEACRLCSVCARAHALVRVAEQTRCASTVPCDHFATPPIAHGGQAHLGPDG